MSSSVEAGDLVPRIYESLRGVDFSNDDVSLYRSPYSVNMWKNYKNDLGKCIETRPDIELLEEYSNTIYGLFFYDINGERHRIVHSGNYLYDDGEIIFENMNTIKTQFFVYNGKLYIKDGVNYLEYDGETIGEVEGYIPTTSISRKPAGGGTVYEDVNMLTGYRKNSFCADGTSTDYYLDVSEFDNEEPKVWINDTLIDNDTKTQISDENGYMKYKDSDGEIYWKRTVETENKLTKSAESVELSGYYTSYCDFEVYVNDVLIDSDIYTIDTDNNLVTFPYTLASKMKVKQVITITYNDQYEEMEEDVGDLTEVTAYPYTYDYKTGVVTFSSPPDTPNTDGQDNVIIQFKKVVDGYRDKINKCTLALLYDNRVFFSGNPDYPNILYHCSLNDPSYCSDLDYYSEGKDDSKIKAIVAGNEALWVFKEASQTNTTVFYHTATTDSDYGKVYVSSHSSIATGCVSTGINFNDDIVFFSERGMEGLSIEVTKEQVLTHRSSLVDSKLTSEENYENMILEEWEGYLLIFIDNRVYLADSRQTYTLDDHLEYEWFYWELAITPTCAVVKDGVLYLGTDDGIYTLTKTEDTEIPSIWTTPKDECKYPYYQKTTAKRGATLTMEGKKVKVEVKTDNNAWEKVDTYKNSKGYIAFKVKRKKWKAIQLRFSSTQNLKIYKCTLLTYLGSYIKK